MVRCAIRRAQNGVDMSKLDSHCVPLMWKSLLNGGEEKEFDRLIQNEIKEDKKEIHIE